MKKPHKCGQLAFRGKCRETCNDHHAGIQNIFEEDAEGPFCTTGQFLDQKMYYKELRKPTKPKKPPAEAVDWTDGVIACTCDTYEDDATEEDEWRTGLCQKTLAEDDGRGKKIKPVPLAPRQLRDDGADEPLRRRLGVLHGPPALAAAAAAAEPRRRRRRQRRRRRRRRPAPPATPPPPSPPPSPPPLIFLSVGDSESDDSNGVVDHETFYHVDFGGGTVKRLVHVLGASRRTQGLHEMHRWEYLPGLWR